MSRTVQGYASAAILVGLCAFYANAEDDVTDTNSVKGFVIDQGGYMGVGTSAPSEQLHVQGNSLTEGVIMGGGNNAQYGSSAVFSGFDTQYGQRPF